MRRVGLQVPWIAAGNCFDVIQDLEEAFNIFMRAPVDNIQIPSAKGDTLKNSRSHTDHDDFHAGVSEAIENFVIPGFFGCHGEF